MKEICQDCEWWTQAIGVGQEFDWKLAEGEGFCKRCMRDGAKFFPAGYEIEGIVTDSDFGCVQWEAQTEEIA